MNNVKDVSTKTLISELQSRGYVTQLLVNNSDVELVLDEINDGREDKIVFTKMEKQGIVKSLDYDMLDKMIWQEIKNEIAVKQIKK